MANSPSSDIYRGFFLKSVGLTKKPMFRIYFEEVYLVTLNGDIYKAHDWVDQYIKQKGVCGND